MHILYDNNSDLDIHIIHIKEKYENLKICIEYGIKILAYLKTLFKSQKEKFKKNEKFDREFVSLITTFNELKTSINKQVNDNLEINRDKRENIPHLTHEKRGKKKKIDWV